MISRSLDPMKVPERRDLGCNGQFVTHCETPCLIALADSQEDFQSNPKVVRPLIDCISDYAPGRDDAIQIRRAE